MESICPRIQYTSPLWGEFDLRGKSAEGPRLPRETVTPHPRLWRDLSRWERWTFDAVVAQLELVML